jgi:hypothetical protein
MAAQAQGVSVSARVRAVYNPRVFEALSGREAVIAKNADASVMRPGGPDRDSPNAYELWGGVEDVLEARAFMEFVVRRYTGR